MSGLPWNSIGGYFCLECLEEASSFICPVCGKTEDVFAKSMVENMALETSSFRDEIIKQLQKEKVVAETSSINMSCSDRIEGELYDDGESPLFVDDSEDTFSYNDTDKGSIVYKAGISPLRYGGSLVVILGSENIPTEEC